MNYKVAIGNKVYRFHQLFEPFVKDFQRHHNYIRANEPEFYKDIVAFFEKSDRQEGITEKEYNKLRHRLPFQGDVVFYDCC